jgi:hypothetical protein
VEKEKGKEKEDKKEGSPVKRVEAVAVAGGSKGLHEPQRAHRR